ncbi:hypothetical protein O3M35_005303 [Rhynocoris fuscipes]|uniref:Maturase K n=1 Tax=Rhynocoris fuscipes TaxID=488301 RepID=A0AAW1DIP5_9HEMI
MRVPDSKNAINNFPSVSVSLANIDLYLRNYYRYFDATFYIQLLLLLVQHRDAQIISKFQNTCEFCVHHLLYSNLILLNLDLISFWATSAKQGCHFT